MGSQLFGCDAQARDGGQPPMRCSGRTEKNRRRAGPYSSASFLYVASIAEQGPAHAVCTSITHSVVPATASRTACALGSGVTRGPFKAVRLAMVAFLS